MAGKQSKHSKQASKGGRSRALALSPSARRSIARQAAQARWRKVGKGMQNPPAGQPNLTPNYRYNPATVGNPNPAAVPIGAPLAQPAVDLDTQPPGTLYGDPRSWYSAYGLLSGAIPYGMPPQRGSRELMIAMKRNPWLHAVTRKIADLYTAVPWRLYVARDGGGNPSPEKAKAYGKLKRRLLSRTVSDATDIRRRAKAISQVQREMGLEEVGDHYWLDMMERPNTALVGTAADGLTQQFLDLQGEAMWILERNSQGLPVQYWPAPPFWVLRTPYRGAPHFLFVFGTYQAYVPETDVVWMKYLDAENPYGRGYGQGYALQDEIDTDEYAAKTMKAFFYNQAVPPLWISMEGASPAQIKAAQREFESDTRGFWNAMRSHWTNVKLQVEALTPTFADQKLIELRKMLRDTTLQTYGMPPEVMGIIEHSNKSTIEAANFIVSEHILKPRLEFRRGVYQARIMPEYDEAFIVDYDSPTPEDAEFELKVFAASPFSFSVDEARELANRDPLDDAEAGSQRPPIPQASGSTPAHPPSLGPLAAEPEVKKEHKAEDDDVENVLEQLRSEYITSELKEQWKDNIREWAQAAADETGVDVSFELLNPLVKKHMEEFFGERMEGVNETTKEALREEIEEGVAAGEGIDELADRVADVFSDAEGYRAERIARTEVMRSSNFASTAAYKLSGVVQKREWVATPDDRVRDEHAELDGTVVSIDEPFESGGNYAMYPGDFGVPELDISCRCTTAPVIDKPESDDDEEGKVAALGESAGSTGGVLVPDGSATASRKPPEAPNPPPPGEQEKPFAGYANFAACVAANQDKDDPNAYCAYIQQQVEGSRSLEAAKAARVERWKAWDKKVAPAEERAAAALRRAFRKQRREVMRALRRLRR